MWVNLFILPIEGVPLDMLFHLYLFERWRDINYIIPADDERADFLDLAVLRFFGLVKDEVHVYIIPLKNAPDFSSAFERDNHRLAVQHLIQNIQRPFGHINTLLPSLWSNICG